MLYLLFLWASVFSIVLGDDVGCTGTSAGGNPAVGCVQRGCCEFDNHITSTSLCNGPNEVCCYSRNICTGPGGSGNFCFNTYGTWVSRFIHSRTRAEVFDSFGKLRDQGITRVYFNVWAEGFVYFNSPTALANGARLWADRLQWAVDAGQQYGLEIYAWFEYGNMAAFQSFNFFASEADAKGWLLYNVRNGQRVYTSGAVGAGSFIFMDPTNIQVQDFVANLVADAARNYNLHGVQLDDHFMIPNGFDAMDALPKSTKLATMESFTIRVRDAVRNARPSTQFSLSPSPTRNAYDHHNVDWARYHINGYVDEMNPQYYYTTSASFEINLNNDRFAVPDFEQAVHPGIRLSGSQFPPVTPANEVNQMIQTSYDYGTRGITFWLADDLLDNTYNPPPLERC